MQPLVERPVLRHQRGRPAPRRLLLGHQRVGGEQQPGDGRAVLKGGADHPQRVDDPHRDHVAVLPRQCVEPVVGAEQRGRGDHLGGRVAGSLSARRTISTPIAWSPVTSAPPSVTLASSAPTACSSAAPPPATIPSAIAALVAASASSTRCRSSFSSAEVGAPTRMTATLPDSEPIRSVSTSSSTPNVARSSSARSCASRNSTASADPPPPMIAVLSAFTSTWRARPSCSTVIVSSENPECLL